MFLPGVRAGWCCAKFPLRFAWVPSLPPPTQSPGSNFRGNPQGSTDRQDSPETQRCFQVIPRGVRLNGIPVQGSRVPYSPFQEGAEIAQILPSGLRKAKPCRFVGGVEKHPFGRSPET